MKDFEDLETTRLHAGDRTEVHARVPGTSRVENPCHVCGGANFRWQRAPASGWAPLLGNGYGLDRGESILCRIFESCGNLQLFDVAARLEGLAAHSANGQLSNTGPLGAIIAGPHCDGIWDSLRRVVGAGLEEGTAIYCSRCKLSFGLTEIWVALPSADRPYRFECPFCHASELDEPKPPGRPSVFRAVKG